MTTAKQAEKHDLLHQVLDGHGGLARWREIGSVSARISATGSVWTLKAQGDLLADVSIGVGCIPQNESRSKRPMAR